MNPSKYIEGLETKNRELTSKNDELKELYEKHAEAVRNFNVEYAKKITRLRADGESITLAKELAKGDKFVGDLFFKMMIAEGVLNACREKIKDVRSAIDTYRSILSWLKAEMESR